MNEEKIDKEFRGLIESCDDSIFWAYIQSWKDEEDIINQMLEWDTETKAEAIKEIELIKKRIRLNELRNEAVDNSIDRLGINILEAMNEDDLKEYEKLEEELK